MKCLDELASLDPKPNLSLPVAACRREYLRIFFGRVARSAKTNCAKVVVDTSGPPLSAALRDGVYFIKPNLREFRERPGRVRPTIKRLSKRAAV